MRGEQNDETGVETASPERLIQGFLRALARLNATISKGDVGPMETFIPLFEQRVGEVEEAEGDGEAEAEGEPVPRWVTGATDVAWWANATLANPIPPAAIASARPAMPIRHRRWRTDRRWT